MNYNSVDLKHHRPRPTPTPQKEYWFPTSTALDIRTMVLPSPTLVAAADVPLFGHALRETTSPWVSLLEHGPGSDPAALFPESSRLADNWAPSGMDALGPLLSDLATSSSSPTEGDAGGGRESAALPDELRSFFSFQLGAWYAGRGAVDEALEALAKSADDRAHALRGRLLRFVKEDAVGAAAAFADISCGVFAIHPQVIVERDLALALLPGKKVAERKRWLEQVSALNDDLLAERRAQLQFDDGEAEAALATLESQQFQLLHQRYARSDLYRQGAGLERDAEVPPTLGEDDLARWGAYREHEDA